MKIKNIAIISLLVFPGVLLGAERVESRVGVSRPSMAAARAPTMVKNLGATSAATSIANAIDNVATKPLAKLPETSVVADNNSTDCRTAYRSCMDEFCLLDESEGNRCACSNNIDQSKKIILEIQQIQTDAEKMFTTDVEREKYGAKAKLVFGESEKAKSSSRATGLSFSAWLNSSGAGDSLDYDADIGDNLYAMASDFCFSKLNACGTTSDMEEMLYSRMITQDCKAYSGYLADQKRDALANKASAEKAVRSARLEMLDITNKYNRGECLLAYKSCISDKGGCGENFENCLDAKLLARRANACENVLDQCMSVKDYVVQDWQEESKTVLAEAAKYADKNRRLTCWAQIQTCLEDGCSTESNSACLTNVNVAAGICPVIDECNEIIPGMKSSVNDKLGFLRSQFCQNDIDKCLQEKCGKNYNAPECLGKNNWDIVALCPQSRFPSCKGETQYNIIVQSAMLQMDYQKLQGCLNHFAEQLGATCGSDMSCLPTDTIVATLTDVPNSEAKLAALREQVRANSKNAVNEFFKKFEKDITVSACMDAKKPSGRGRLGDTVFNSAKIVAEIGAENRAMRGLETKIAELSRKMDVEAAKQNCLTTYKVEKAEKGEKNYSYIKSVSFEPSLRNCHVCRNQQVCETGGESKATSGLKAAGGGLAAGASAGTMVMPGWGTAIGGVVGAVGGFFAGSASGGKQEFCQEVSSCEDINM